jgi:hypothetical protein
MGWGNLGKFDLGCWFWNISHSKLGQRFFAILALFWYSLSLGRDDPTIGDHCHCET